MNKDHVEAAMTEVKNIFEKASIRIERLNVGEKVTATGLAEELAPEFNMKGSILYPTVKIFVKHCNPKEFKVSKGAKGGIERIANKVTDGDAQ